jgi:hypothetical protein
MYVSVLINQFLLAAKPDQTTIYGKVTEIDGKKQLWNWGS